MHNPWTTGCDAVKSAKVVLNFINDGSFPNCRDDVVLSVLFTLKSQHLIEDVYSRKVRRTVEVALSF